MIREERTPIYLVDLNTQLQEEIKDEIYTERSDLISALKNEDNIQIGQFLSSSEYRVE